MQTKTVFETPWFEVEELAPGQPANPSSEPFYRITGTDGVICLMLTPDDHFVMVRQFRPAVGKITLEFPAGAIDPGETGSEAAIRETREETGYVCQTCLWLGSGGIFLNRFGNMIHFYLGLAATPHPGWQPEAGMEPVLLPRRALPGLVTDGKFEHTAALAAMTLAEIRFGVSLLRDSLATIETTLLNSAPASDQ